MRQCQPTSTIDWQGSVGLQESATQQLGSPAYVHLERQSGDGRVRRLDKIVSLTRVLTVNLTISREDGEGESCQRGAMRTQHKSNESPFGLGSRSSSRYSRHAAPTVRMTKLSPLIYPWSWMHARRTTGRPCHVCSHGSNAGFQAPHLPGRNPCLKSPRYRFKSQDRVYPHRPQPPFRFLIRRAAKRSL